MSIAALAPTATLAPCRLSRAQYEALDAVNYSTLKAMRGSPLHYQYRVGTPQDLSPSMLRGLAVHTAVFEPDRFPVEYAVFDGPVRRGKEWEACKVANPGRQILKLDEYETALRIRDAVRGHPVAGPYLRAGRAEQSFSWTDKATGLPCKGRLDWLTSAGVLCDLKTAKSIEARPFAAQTYTYGYHIQAAFYLAGLEAHGVRRQAPRLIAVEGAAPHDVAVYELDEHVLYAAEEELSGLLARLAECRASGVWPGRYTEEQVLQLPGWAFPSEDDADGLGITFGEE